jgi:hypothetical protein
MAYGILIVGYFISPSHLIVKEIQVKNSHIRLLQPLIPSSHKTIKNDPRRIVLNGCPEGTFIEPFRKVFRLIRVGTPTLPRNHPER